VRLSAEMTAQIERLIEDGRATCVMVMPRRDSPLMEAIPAHISEDEFTQQVISHAQARGWFVAHFRAARVVNNDGSTGWRTPVQADGAGFPDLVLVRDRVVFAELKSNKGRQRAAQKTWQANLATAGAEVYLWRPRDWPDIVSALK
jgi:hypothetical protein